MPLHEYIKRIYEDVNDPSYIIRFLNHLISTRYKRVSYSVNGHTVEPLITGILEEIKTKKRFYSIAQFYTYATGIKANESDISVLANVFVTREYSVMRVICNIKEDEILNFFDQKYRTFLMYRDVRKRIKFYALKYTNNAVKLQWGDDEFTLHHTKLICNGDDKTIKILEKYEAGLIDRMYYCADDGRHLISEA